MDYSKAKSAPADHLKELTSKLQAKGGLDYVPRERTPQGRVFDHAADSRLLLSHLISLDVPATVSKVEPVFWINSTESDDSSALIKIRKEFIELTLNANGKAELYFHAYFWSTYFEQIAQIAGGDQSALLKLPEVLRMNKLSNKPQQVYDTIKKFPFGKSEYDRFVSLFGGRQTIKKVRLIEELQRALFAA